jgi:squalene cyclase
MQSPDKLKPSLEKALSFVKYGRNEEGLWSDFQTLAGESVYWVSGYVGYSLTGYREVRREAWLEKIGISILKHQGVDGGWGYGPGVPADADSTSWCLLFLSRLGRSSREAFEKALDFLWMHQNCSDGGFSTYARPHEIGRYTRLDDMVSFEGWSSSHVCVTAVAVQALTETGASRGVREALNFIRKAQSREGYWESYWWNGRLYATFNSMKALKARGSRDDAERLRRAQDWIASVQLRDGSWSDSMVCQGIPFPTALALRGLMLEHRPEFLDKIREGIEWLLIHQLPDGSWNSHHILRIPHPSVRQPWKQSFWKRDGKAVNALIKDHNRLWSTATAFSALLEFTERLSSGGIEA